MELQPGQQLRGKPHRPGGGTQPERLPVQHRQHLGNQIQQHPRPDGRGPPRRPSRTCRLFRPGHDVDATLQKDRHIQPKVHRNQASGPCRRPGPCIFQRRPSERSGALPARTGKEDRPGRGFQVHARHDRPFARGLPLRVQAHGGGKRAPSRNAEQAQHRDLHGPQRARVRRYPGKRGEGPEAGA